jgi:serine/threonine-protein kinase
MNALDAKLLAWLEAVREELGGSTATGAHPLEGCLLEGCPIGGLLGVGSFAAVFELRDSDGQPRAVKVLQRTGAGSEAADEDLIFRREVDIGRRLSHPTVARIHRVVERPRSRFVVLDLVQGHTWNSLTSQPLSPARYRQLFRPLAEGLQHAHELGVVHRDLKPENVMLAQDGTVRILDFGLARQSGGTESTITGQFKGTPMYSAPEQVKDSKRVSPACDQFSFGLLSFQMLTGQFPYPLDPKQPLQTLFARLMQPAARLSSVWPEVPAAADQVMARMLAMQPQDRYPSVVEAFEALSAALVS